MLQQMRQLPKWVGFVLFLPLAASFIVWGIADIFRGDVDTSLATVGGTKIDEVKFDRDMSNFRRRSGAQATPAKTQEYGEKLLQRSIVETALDNVANEMGLVITDAQVSAAIRTIPDFRGPLGSFDEATFRQVLTANNFTEASFVAQIRQDMRREQIVTAAATTAAFPPAYGRALFSFFNERRAAQYVVLPPDAAGPIAPPSDQVLMAYVKAHAAEFSTPEYRELTYAAVTEEDAEKLVPVTDVQLRQAYELRKDTYIIPDKRDVERINFPDEASAKAARAKIETGAKFEDIAAQRGVSGSALKLGTLAQADLGPIQGPVAFALPINGVSQPVKGTFGWALLRVTAETKGKTTTFDMARPELLKEYLADLGKQKLEDISNAFDDARNAGDDMAQAARKVGMRVVHVASVDANGLAPDGTKANVPAAPEFLEQVFKSDAGTEGEPFGASDGGRYVVKVEGVTPPKLKPFASIRAQALAQWSEEQRLLALSRKAAQLAGLATAAGSLAPVSSAVHAPVAASGMLTRREAVPNINQALLTKIFESLPGRAVYGPTPDGKSFVVAFISGVLHLNAPVADPRYRAFSQSLDNLQGADIAEQLGTAAKADQHVKINQSQVDHALGVGGT